MARPKAAAPSRRYHLSGQSVVTIDSRDFYLGKHDSPESIARYAVLIGIYQKHGLSLPDDFDAGSLDELAAILLGQIAPGAVATKQADQPVLVRHITVLYREQLGAERSCPPRSLVLPRKSTGSPKSAMTWTTTMVT